jgi:hypothetical protein
VDRDRVAHLDRLEELVSSPSMSTVTIRWSFQISAISTPAAANVSIGFENSSASGPTPIDFIPIRHMPPMVDPTVVGVQRIAPEMSLPYSSLLLVSVQGAASVRPANMFSVYDPLVLNACLETVALPVTLPGRTTRPLNVFFAMVSISLILSSIQIASHRTHPHQAGSFPVIAICRRSSSPKSRSLE